MSLITETYLEGLDAYTYFIEWDSNASSDDDDDDDKPSKGVAGIAIKEAPSLLSTPHCLMAKGGEKVLQDDEAADATEGAAVLVEEHL